MLSRVGNNSSAVMLFTRIRSMHVINSDSQINTVVKCKLVESRPRLFLRVNVLSPLGRHGRTVATDVESLAPPSRCSVPGKTHISHPETSADRHIQRPWQKTPTCVMSWRTCSSVPTSWPMRYVHPTFEPRKGELTIYLYRSSCLWS